MQVPAEEVQQAFRLRSEDFRTLRDDCSRFAGKAAAFAERVGWGDMAALLKHFQVRCCPPSWPAAACRRQQLLSFRLWDPAQQI
jgi:hypothetical protein